MKKIYLAILIFCITYAQLSMDTETQLQLTIKIAQQARNLSFNKNKKIAVLYQENFPSSMLIRNEIIRLEENYKDIHFEYITYKDSYIIDPDIVILCPSRGLDPDRIFTNFSLKKKLNFGFVNDFYKQAYVTFGLKNNKPKLMILKEALTSLNTGFSGSFLSLCDIIEY